MALEFHLLGTIEAVRAGERIRLGGRRQRALLALLLLDPGRVVSSDRLIDELWHGEPPPSASSTLRVYVSRLRTALGGELPTARPPGYVLDIEPGQVDAHRFEELVRQGTDALANGAPGRAVRLLRAGLDLWRGPALDGVGDFGALALGAQRLEELRRVCRDELVEGQLALGRHGELIPELERAVAEDAFRERAWRQLILALYRSERQTDALAAYRRARERLSTELGLEPSEELRELERAILRHGVARPTVERARHNVPAQLTPLLGRDAELTELDGHLDGSRLVTLTGVAGAGKTRLAVAAAAGQVGSWAGGVWFVDLAPQSDGALVPTAVARALGAGDRPDVRPLDALVEHLRREEILLVLDNCEHLAAAAAELVHELLRSCEAVRVLATSRVALGVLGEVDYAVQPLPVPPEDVDEEELRRFAAVQLFLERARAARRGLVGGAAELRDVSAICRELDGLPLALELAAARAKVLSFAEIASRLSDRFALLQSTRRTVDPRHRTLAAALDWSFDLLDADAQELLAALSVFVGPFTLPDVAAVATAGDDDRALELLGQLVESSLVAAAASRQETRYRLLETIKQYAATHFDPERATVLRRRHAEHCLAVVDAATPDYIHFSPQQQREGLETLDAHRDDVHAAVAWALGHDPDLALALATKLRHYWLIRGYVREGLAWLSQALARSGRSPPATRAAGLAGTALLARLSGEFERARAYAEDGLVAAGEDAAPRVTCLNVLTTLAGRDRDVEAARRHCDEAVAIARTVGSERLERIACFVFAEAALHAGQYADVDEAAGRSLELARSADDGEAMALALSRLGASALHQDRLELASERYAEALRHAATLGFPGTVAICCEGLGAVAARRVELVPAARLLGLADGLRRRSGALPLAVDEEIRKLVAGALPPEYDDEVEAARRLDLDAAVGEAARLASAGVTVS